MDKVHLTAIDLFSGVGGTTLGLKRAGFDVLAAFDNFKIANKAYGLNHPDVRIYSDDITLLEPQKIRKELRLKKKELDLLAGCPPCQGFSRMRGKSAAAGTKDKRNDLIFIYLDFVKEFRPKTMILENVPGLMKDERMNTIREQLTPLGYQLRMGIFDASNFGVPQRRKRFIMVGSRVGKVIKVKKKTKKKTVRDTIASLKPAGKSGDWMHDRIVIHSKEVLDVIKLIPKNGGFRSDLPKEYQLPSRKKQKKFNDIYARMSWDDVSPTLTSQCIRPSSGRFLHPTKNRGITLREAALLQGFPKFYKFPKEGTMTQLSILIGNAFPPPFTREHAKIIYKSLIA